mmetsp:Transcript_56179/g.171102  ORF Transcript_56179/g.171102 Transcript_56179/m.171102 type:complete len:256 (+) Transcript_56179:1335-2102(+)
MHMAPQAMFACVNGTIFGFFVVPDVCKTNAKSSRLTVKRGLPRAAPFNGRPAVCFFRVKRPAISLLGNNSNNFSTLAFLATPIAVPVWAWSCSESVSLSCTTNALAGKSRNSNSNSSLLKPMFSGAKVHRKENAKNATAASGPLGMAVQSRSERSMPTTSTSSLMQNSFKAFKLSGFRPSVAWRNGSELSGMRSWYVVHVCESASLANTCAASSALPATALRMGPTSWLPLWASVHDSMLPRRAGRQNQRAAPGK